jgi:hypothetical protein
MWLSMSTTSLPDTTVGTRNAEIGEAFHTFTAGEPPWGFHNFYALKPLPMDLFEQGRVSLRMSARLRLEDGVTPPANTDANDADFNFEYDLKATSPDWLAVSDGAKAVSPWQLFGGYEWRLLVHRHLKEGEPYSFNIFLECGGPLDPSPPALHANAQGQLESTVVVAAGVTEATNESEGETSGAIRDEYAGTPVVAPARLTVPLSGVKSLLTEALRENVGVSAAPGSGANAVRHNVPTTPLPGLVSLQMDVPGLRREIVGLRAELNTLRREIREGRDRLDNLTIYLGDRFGELGRFLSSSPRSP